MTSLPGAEEQPLIQSVGIGERMIEVTFMEPRDRTKSSMMLRVLSLPISEVEAEFAEFDDAARQLLDAMLLVARQEQNR